MNLSWVKVEAWDDVGGHLASAAAEAHMCSSGRGFDDWRVRET